MADHITIQKNSREEIRIELGEYRGHRLVNLRTWWSDGSSWRPSKKGLVVQVSSLPELRAALEELEAEALKRGLLEIEDYEQAGLPAPEGV